MNMLLAQRYAEVIFERLIPVCKRIEIVGGLKRRDSTEVHDVEFLLIQKPGSPRPEFGEKNPPLTYLDRALREMEADRLLKQPTKKADGPRLKRRAFVFDDPDVLVLAEFCLELFIVTEETWGIQNVIRTGPSTFSHCFVTNQQYVTKDGYQGLLPSDYSYVPKVTRIMDKRIEKILVLPEEENAIELLRFGWIPPGKRYKYCRKVR